MKKTILFCLGLIFISTVSAQQKITISGQTTVEVGVPYSYSFQFVPVYPSDPNGVVADAYEISTWIVSTTSNDDAINVPGYTGTVTNTSEYYSISTNTNPLVIPIQWGDGGVMGYDTVTAKVSGRYYKASTNQTIGYFTFLQAEKSITVERISAPIISGAAAVPDCNQNNTPYYIANATNGNQYLWTVTNGAAVVGSATSNAVTVKPPVTGTYTVKCRVKRTGANPNYYKETTRTTTRTGFTSNASITGNQTICNSVTYNISGLLAGESVASWSLSNSTAATITASGATSATVTKTAAGGGVYLTASILNSCGTQTTPKSLALFAGAPQPFTLVRASNETCDGIKYHYVPFEIFNRNPLINYTFTPHPPPGVSVTVSSQTYNGVVQNVLRFPKTYTGVIDITVNSSNSCGSFMTYAEEEISSCSGMGLRVNVSEESAQTTRESNNYKVYPNPSNDLMFVELRNSDNQPSKGAPVTAEIFDLLGQSKAKVNIVDNKVVIDVKSLNKGIYVLRVVVDGAIENHRIFIQ